ncbi:hypothetical protein [Gordonia aichiensis]|uniref:Lipoprotein n=1 Tax=Gordonia aichiensis NBRC 108223 TaxID=1220583 RepID=L7KEQ4_9ACTN|nr:hypothetical protein [Gordonia aichiensis]GAC47089.1 hypothetical protein GOACH_03_01050 [Gordonia aichiensis NBRC 108223]
MPLRPHTTGRRLAVGLVGVAAVLVIGLSGCSSSAGEVTTVTPASSTSYVDNPVDPAELDQLLDRIAGTGLPVTNRHDATQTLCPSAGCTVAVEADQVILMKFPTTGRAELYNGAHPGNYQVVDIVMSFPSGTDPAQNQRYTTALQGMIR